MKTILNLISKNKKTFWMNAFVIFAILLAFISNNRFIMMGSLVLFYVLIFVSKLPVSYSLVFFSLPLMGVFDNLGFKYFFNFAIIVLFIKLIFYIFTHRIKIKYPIILFGILFLFLYDCLNAMINNLFSLSYLGNFNIWITYLILFLTISIFSEISIKKIYYYFYTGFVFSVFLCGFSVLMKWGVHIPTAYRFVGMSRDPNYYSIFALSLILAAPILFNSKRKWFFMVSVFAMGILSISKMYILMVFGCLGLYLLKYFYDLVFLQKKIRFEKVILGIGVGVAAIVFLSVSGLMGTILDKYIFRLGTTTLTTGRDYLQSTFMHKLFSETQTFLFGRSLDYNYVYMIQYSQSSAMVAHNTYIDVLMTFGIFVGLFYVLFLIYIFSKYPKKSSFTYSKFVLIAFFIISIFSLSYLKIDSFIFIVLFILICVKKGGEWSNENLRNHA